MANRFPLIVDGSALQIKELPANENIDLTDSSIVNAVGVDATNITVSGIATVGFASVSNIVASGIVTSTGGFVGGVTGNVTGNLTGNLTGEVNSATFDTNPSGVVVTGVVTATSFVGDGSTLTGTGSTVGDDTTTDESFFPVLTQQTAGSISTSIVSSSKLSFNPLSGIVSTTSVLAGNISVTGVSTLSGGLNTQDLLTEEVKVTAGKLSDNLNIDVENGMVHLFTTQETTVSTPNIRYNASTALNDKMSVGQSAVVTLITTAASTAYSANITIDGNTVTENWIGGAPPLSGGTSGVDTHSFTIIKTGNNAYTVIGNHNITS